jgi:hypothetical protein
VRVQVIFDVEISCTVGMCAHQNSSVWLKQDLLDCLGESVGFSRAEWSDEQNWWQPRFRGCGDCDDGFFLLRVQSGIETVVPLSIFKFSLVFNCKY